MIHVHARNPAGASFHKKRSHFTHGCSAVRRGGWRRSVVNANHSLMGILQTARKCLCNFILILIQLPIEVAFCVPREPKRSQHFCHKFIFKLALGGLTAQGRASSSQAEAWCPEPVRWGTSALPPAASYSSNAFFLVGTNPKSLIWQLWWFLPAAEMVVFRGEGLLATPVSSRCIL